MECSVCCEKMAKEIRCSCGFVCCRNCARTYLAEQVQEPHCMSCKKYWELDYLEEAIGKTYTSTTFKKIRADVYLEYEKNQLAHTQSLVAKFKRDEELNAKILALTNKNKTHLHGTKGCIHCMGGSYKSHWCTPCQKDKFVNFNYKASQVTGFDILLCLTCKKGGLGPEFACLKCKSAHCDKCFTPHKRDFECPVFSCICVEYSCDECCIKQNKIRIQEYRSQIRDAVEVKEKREFIMNCQSTGCKGFLSTKYKCGLCETYTCSTCLQVKDPGHECKADDVSTVRMIREETKPCPKCSTRISKIDGCDQMWCVECKTAFSWKSGNIVNGAIHNPHYYEFLRQTQGHVPRADNPCGEIPELHVMRQHGLKIVGNNTSMRTNMYSLHRFLQELNWRCGIVNPYEPSLVQNRIYYLLNRMDEKKFTQKAFMYYQRSLRFRRMNELLQMLKQVLLDQLSILMDILKNPNTLAQTQGLFVEVHKVCCYFMEQKKRSPYTSIREEHVQLMVEHKKILYTVEEFDMSLWLGNDDPLTFMLR